MITTSGPSGCFGGLSSNGAPWVEAVVENHQTSSSYQGSSEELGQLSFGLFPSTEED